MPRPTASNKNLNNPLPVNSPNPTPLNNDNVGVSAAELNKLEESNAELNKRVHELEQQLEEKEKEITALKAAEAAKKTGALEAKEGEETVFIRSRGLAYHHRDDEPKKKFLAVEVNGNRFDVLLDKYTSVPDWVANNVRHLE